MSMSPESTDSAIEQWWRPDRRTPLAATLMLAGAMLVAYVPIVIGNLRDGWPVIIGFFVGGLAVLGVAYVIEVMRVRRTSLAVDDERVRYRFEFVMRKHASVPRERVRTVEITADPAQRLLGIATLKLGSGEKDGQITLRALDRELAERLRARLLDRSAVATHSADEPADTMEPGVGELARWHPSWLRYAPLSLWTFVLAGAAFGVPLQVAQWFNAESEVWERLTTPVRGNGLIVGIAIIAGIALVVGVAASIALHAEAWWGFRLERASDGTLHIQRGLIVSRSTTFEGNRIRGAVLVEPLGARVAGGARIELIALGLGKKKDDQQRAESSTVMPEAPRAEVLPVLAAITGEGLPTLAGHPRAARGKRLRWAAVGTVTLTAVAAVLVLTTGVGWWLIPSVAVMASGSLVWLASASYAALGHAFTDRHVVIRYGALRRATHAVRREAVVSWNVTQSVFQRRLGLATAAATTAADLSLVPSPDMGVGQVNGVLAESDQPLWGPLIAVPSSGR